MYETVRVSGGGGRVYEYIYAHIGALADVRDYSLREYVQPHTRLHTARGMTTGQVS